MKTKLTLSLTEIAHHAIAYASVHLGIIIVGAIAALAVSLIGSTAAGENERKPPPRLECPARLDPRLLIHRARADEVRQAPETVRLLSRLRCEVITAPGLGTECLWPWTQLDFII
jgi:hypothetical protein